MAKMSEFEERALRALERMAGIEETAGGGDYLDSLEFLTPRQRRALRLRGAASYTALRSVPSFEEVDGFDEKSAKELRSHLEDLSTAEWPAVSPTATEDDGIEDQTASESSLTGPMRFAPEPLEGDEAGAEAEAPVMGNIEATSTTTGGTQAPDPKTKKSK
jgi:hypothetical protein